MGFGSYFILYICPRSRGGIAGQLNALGKHTSEDQI
jgi:hypothetical protein